MIRPVNMLILKARHFHSMGDEGRLAVPEAVIPNEQRVGDLVPLAILSQRSRRTWRPFPRMVPSGGDRLPGRCGRGCACSLPRGLSLYQSGLQSLAVLSFNSKEVASCHPPCPWALSWRDSLASPI